jgi:hypothetical protein
MLYMPSTNVRSKRGLYGLITSRTGTGFSRPVLEL